MIQKNRLEELIKQKAIIYTMSYSMEYIYDKYVKIPFEIALKENYSVGWTNSSSEEYGLIRYNGEYYSQEEGCKYSDTDSWALNELFETKEDALWAIETNASRVEEFTPPTYENFNEYSFTSKGNHYFIKKCKTGYSADRKNPYIIRVDRNGYINEFKDWEYTKENYKEAIEYAKKLFLGRKVNE